MAKARITITLDEELLEEISLMAEKDHRSVSSQIVHMVVNFKE